MLTCIVFVPCPLTIDAPEPVIVQLKLVALGAEVEYVCIPGPHGSTGPAITAGTGGATVFTGMFRQDVAEVPQTFTAATQINPLAYAGPKATVILFEVEDPVAPVGSVQIYEDAPGTGVTE
jgi:hypothetical protein